jgi:hypothetical protein
VRPLGSDYRVDHFLGNESVHIVHDGADASRMDKITAIGKWPDCYSCLRVCWENPRGLSNCGVCEKCLYTMTCLEIAGTRGKFTTFPADYSVASLRLYKPRSRPELTHVRLLLEHARKAGRGDLVRALKRVLRRTALKSIIRRMLASRERS